jgi:TIR domain
MGRVEKTVFLCYRRTNAPWALAIAQNLTHNGYDVFFDFNGIASGDFEVVILGNILARAHFIVLLTPSALERCDEPGDWFRREIETALGAKRNIVPLMLEGFSFSTPSIASRLTGKLAALKQYNAMQIPVEYFEEAMDRLVGKYLNVALDQVLPPPLLLEGTVPRNQAQTDSYYSCFISFSTKDEEFAQRLYEDLQDNGVECWFSPHSMRGGEKIHEQIDAGIRKYDRLLLILSDNSIQSPWVKTEIMKARKRELLEKGRVLFPLRLVDFERLLAWECFDADTGTDHAAEIRAYFIPNFSNWKQPDAYNKEFGKLLRNLVRRT